MTALRGSGVPVPKTYLLCDDPSVIGTPFFVMEYIAGHPMIDATLADRSPDDRRAIYRSMIEVLALPAHGGLARRRPLELSENRATTSRGRSIAGRRSTARRKRSGLTPWSG